MKNPLSSKTRAQDRERAERRRQFIDAAVPETVDPPVIDDSTGWFSDNTEAVATSTKGRSTKPLKPKSARKGRVPQSKPKLRLPYRSKDDRSPEQGAGDVLQEDAVRDKLARVAFVLACVVLTVTVAATIGAGAPYLTGQWSPFNLSVGAAVCVIISAGIRRLFWDRSGITLRLVRTCTVIGWVLIGLFTWGLTTSVIVDGDLYPRYSTEAKTHRLLEEVLEDREFFGSADELLALDQAEAKVRFNEYGPAQDRMTGILERWALVDNSSLPDGGFVGIVANMKGAAFNGQLALERREQLLSQPDARLQLELETSREAFVRSALAVSKESLILSERYGFDLTEESSALE